MVDIEELMRGIPTDCDVVTFDISEQFVYIFDDQTGEIIFYDWVH